MTWLMRSSLTCIERKSGMARDITMPMKAAMIGRITTSSSDNGTSVRSAMITPPTIRIGAETITVRPTKTRVWTCWTSLVLRVMSDAAPNPLTSTCEKVSTLVKIALRTSRPKPIATRAPKYTAITEAIASSPVTTSITAPVRRMYSVSPLATPWSMMSALRSGRVRLPIAPMSRRNSTSTSWVRYGRR